MLIVRSVAYSFVVWMSCAVLLPSPAAARDTYFSPNCGSCHSTAKPTCNGCHVHGTHPDFLAATVGTINLKTSTDKTSYVEGDPIVVTLEGSNMADFSGWVGVRIYDASGTEVTRKQAQLSCAPYPAQFGDKCDLPMKLSVPAKLGWTRLYAAWAGNQFDRSGAAYGTLLGTTFGAGRRPLKDGSGNQVTNHIEEIVVTGTFTVTPAPPKPVPDPIPETPPTPVPTPDPGAGNGTSSTEQAGSGSDASNPSGGTPSTTSSTTKQTAASGAFDVFFLGFLAIAARVFAARATPRTTKKQSGATITVGLVSARLVS